MEEPQRLTAEEYFIRQRQEAVSSQRDENSIQFINPSRAVKSPKSSKPDQNFVNFSTRPFLQLESKGIIV
jgi:hypothetical protein